LRSWQEGGQGRPRRTLRWVTAVGVLAVAAAGLYAWGSSPEAPIPPARPRSDAAVDAQVKTSGPPPPRRGWAAEAGESRTVRTTASLRRRQLGPGGTQTGLEIELELQEVLQEATPDALSFRHEIKALRVQAEGGLWLSYDSRDPQREWQAFDAMLEQGWTARRSTTTQAVEGLIGASAAGELVVRRLEEQSVAPGMLLPVLERGFGDEPLQRRLTALAGLLPRGGAWDVETYTNTVTFPVGERRVRCRLRVVVQGEHLVGELMEAELVEGDGRLERPALQVSARFADGRLQGSWLDLSFEVVGSEVRERVDWTLSFAEAGVQRCSLPEDPQGAFATWERGAIGGDPGAMLHLGRAYALGIGTERDLAQALRWFAKAAALGELEGYVEAGRIHLHGAADLPPDPVQANRLFRVALDRGHEAAWAELAVSHRLWLVGPVDKAKAIDCLKRAAGAGATSAMVSLGDMLRCGEGGPRDLVTAELLYRRAAELGDGEGARKLEDLGQLIENIRSQ
jgi:hypothetical protein